jgi:hypothetical protein
VGTSGLSTTFGSGLVADPSDTIYQAGEGDNGRLFTIDRLTGAPTTVATLQGQTGNPISALAFNSAGVLFGSVLGGGGGGGPANLVIIDTTDGAVTVVGQTVDNLDAIAFASPEALPSAVPTMSGPAFVAMMVVLTSVAMVTLRRRGHRPRVRSGPTFRPPRVG